MKLGFTGTRNGLTLPQKEALASLLLAMMPASLSAGVCQGSDDSAMTMAHMLGIRVICHPPIDDRLRAYNAFADETLPAKTHFARNRDIVNTTDRLLATPPCKPLPDKGGTAYTVGVARKVGKPVLIIWPDGTETREGMG